MPTTPLFPLPEGLEMISLSETSEELLLRVSSRRPSSLCPHCSKPSSALHWSFHSGAAHRISPPRDSFG